MKNSICIFISLLVLTSALSGQNHDCDFAENSLDKFTKARKLITKPKLVWQEGALFSRVDASLSVGLVNDVKLVIAQLDCNKTLNFDWFDSFSSLWLLNESDEIINLKPYDRCKYNISGDSDWVSYWQYYKVSDSTWLKLSDFQIKSIRVILQDPHGIQYHDMEIKAKNQNVLSNQIQCINSTITSSSKKKKD